jgi:hypothetical protein
MAANPFSRGTSPGRARPPHRGSFKIGHEKHGGRQKNTPNAISARARKAIAAAARRVPRGTTRNRNHWQWVNEKNPLINKARERQGQFTLTGTPRVRSRTFSMKAFNKGLSAVATRAIKTDQFVPIRCGVIGLLPPITAVDRSRLRATSCAMIRLELNGT